MEKARKEINAAMQEAIAANAQAGDEAVENVENTEAAEKNVEKAEPAGEKNQTHDILDPPTLVRFTGPYKFEGKEYTEINLSGLETLTARDMVDAESWLTKHGIVSALPEMTFEYVSFIASVASGQPIEFFKGLSPKNAIKVKNKVTSFFYGQD